MPQLYELRAKIICNIRNMREALLKAGIAGKSQTWAFLNVSEQSAHQIRKFFIDRMGLNSSIVEKELHLTVYFAEFVSPSIIEMVEKCNIEFETEFTRFMVLKPGGENANPLILPDDHKIGIRVNRKSDLRKIIEEYRQRISKFENQEMLNNKKNSTRSKSAFGNPNFQPHITLLKRGHGLTELSLVGRDFRDEIKSITFDRFKIVTR